MDGIHDLGGREGYGPVDAGEKEEAFHAPWEARMFGIARCLTRAPDWNIDWFRHCRELIEPPEYLNRAYFDQWMTAYTAMIVNSGMATVAEVASGKAAGALAGVKAPAGPSSVATAKKAEVKYQRKATADPRFTAGAAVRTASHGHSGHTRLPAYARGRLGTIESYHGFHPLPDAHAHLKPGAEPLYTVAFARAELWPDELLQRGTVYLDLWESYLEPR
ncbi:nitrile hydratase subunit beta [soil metagenome]